MALCPANSLSLLLDVLEQLDTGLDRANREFGMNHLRAMQASGYPRDILTNQGGLDEGVSVLPKPDSLESLARHVRSLLDR